MQPILNVRGVFKSFPAAQPILEMIRSPFRRQAHAALSGVTFLLNPGETAAVIGPNGAGKTTLARIIGGTVLPDRGEAMICGTAADKAAARARVSIASPEDHSFHPRLTVREALRFRLALSGISSPDEVIEGLPESELLRLPEILSRRIAALSAGEKARCSLAAALMTSPALLISDELSRVLDPGMAGRFQNILQNRMSSGMASLVITHDMNEAARSQRIIVMKNGMIAADGSWTEVFTAASEAFGTIPQQGLKLESEEEPPPKSGKTLASALRGELFPKAPSAGPDDGSRAGAEK